MKVVQINSTCGNGSTGKICVSLSKLMNEQNISNYILYSVGHSNYELGFKYGNWLYYKLQALKGRILGNNGFNSHISTLAIINKLESIKPDIIHLHNLHSNDVNINMLFKYLKKHNIKVVWTFHDCWAFTGYCTHFMFLGCSKFKKICKECPYKKETSWFFDRSEEIHKRKIRALSGCNLTIITPSQWLATCVRQSRLKNFPVIVINNGIDTSTFKPCKSDFRSRYNIIDKKIILGVAFDWGIKKGLDVFIELATKLSDKYQIILVGTNGNIDKLLPSNVISIHRTNNQKELAEIYSTADVFLNPTREDNYPTVNMESIACGTPVITFDTGGSSETVNEQTGILVKDKNIESVILSIEKVCNTNEFNASTIIKNSERFKAQVCFQQYLDLYKTLS